MDGVRSVSYTHLPSILRARKTISQWTKAECDELAEKALACNTAAEVKALLESAAR